MKAFLFPLSHIIIVVLYLCEKKVNTWPITSITHLQPRCSPHTAHIRYKIQCFKEEGGVSPPQINAAYLGSTETATEMRWIALERRDLTLEDEGMSLMFSMFSRKFHHCYDKHRPMWSYTKMWWKILRWWEVGNLSQAGRILNPINGTRNTHSYINKNYCGHKYFDTDLQRRCER